MSTMQKVGGVAALIEAATFVVGFALFFTFLVDHYTDRHDDPGAYVAFLADNRAILHVWNLIIFVVFGIALVVLALALHDQLKTGAPALAAVATAFGLIWAGLVIATGMVATVGLGTVVDLYATDPEQAVALWLALDAVENGLGGQQEITGGLWVLLASWAALQGRSLPRALSWLGIVAGVSGLLTVVPALEALGAVFGLGLILWFVWLGIVMLRGDREVTGMAPAQQPTP
jgi:hypothetical protein